MANRPMRTDVAIALTAFAALMIFLAILCYFGYARWE